MKSLNDLLVSYKQVESPKQSDIESVELPSTRYQRMLSYLDTKKETPKESAVENTTETEDTSDGFIGWTFSAPTSSTTSSESSICWSSPYSSRRNQWVSDMTASYKRQGLNDNAIKNLIAKNSLESAWGASAQGDYNFGNMTAGKSWTGRIVEGNDKDKDGKLIKQKFRAYDSLDDFVKDEIQFLTRLYDFDQNDDLSTFLNKLQGGNKGKRYYAEDPSYKNKVRSRYMKI